jgi:dimethylhistidine N-methyltransferase
MSNSFNQQAHELQRETDIQVLDLEPPLTNLEQEIFNGLAEHPKKLSPKFFYDTKGSELFDEITALDEYYLTRTEKQILTANAHDIAQTIGTHKVIIEPGSGSSEKVQLLLEALKPSYYVPMEISTDYMLDVANNLQQKYPALKMLCVKADYTYELPANEQLPEGDKIAFFPGSTIGNFDPDKATQFLSSVRKMVGDSGGLLIGVDLKKDSSIIEAAYNDAKGVTAAFNLNILDNINQLIGTDFDTAKWQHSAVYDEQQGCINMHLIANEAHQISNRNASVNFAKHEKVHTEHCYKFSMDDIAQMMAQTGFEIIKTWTDPQAYFAVLYCTSSERTSSKCSSSKCSASQ